METRPHKHGRSPETSSAVKAGTEITTPLNPSRARQTGEPAVAGGEIKPEFGTFATVRALFGIPRSSAYEMEQRGEIAFVRLRKRGQVRGRVLVDLDSVRDYLARCAGEASATATPV